MIPTASRKSGLTLVALLIPLALGLAACNSPEKRHEARLTPPQVQVALSGSAQFFQNRLQAVATLNSVPRQSQGPRNKRVVDPRIQPHATGITSQSSSYASSQGQGPAPSQGRGPSGRHGRDNLGSQQPPVALRVTFTNQGNTPISLSIREINSVLGNFVAQPDRATLAPSESLELEPMISRMGVISGSIPLQLELRAEGQTESQTIRLRERPATQ